MSEVVYTCRTRVARLHGPLRRATVPGSDEPIWFGVHDEVADHYGVDRGGEAERTTTLDYVVAAVAGLTHRDLRRRAGGASDPSWGRQALG
jgi:hypothetical protein